MNADVERLQKLVPHNPVTLNLLATLGMSVHCCDNMLNAGTRAISP